MKHDVYIQVNKYYYRCPVTKALYVKVSETDTTIKFRCVAKLNKNGIETKYKRDVKFL